VATLELRDLGDEISLFVLLYDHGKFLHALLLDKKQIDGKKSLQQALPYCIRTMKNEEEQETVRPGGSVCGG
jgi:hypothetical protein